MAISLKLIDYLKGKGWWHDEESDSYRNELISYGLNPSSDIFSFYLHAEGLPNFPTTKGELIQLAWFLLNTNYKRNSESLRAALNISKDFLFLDSFEGGGGYLYNCKNECVYEYKVSEVKKNSNNIVMIKQWADFNIFLEFLFLQQHPESASTLT